VGAGKQDLPASSLARTLLVRCSYAARTLLVALVAFAATQRSPS